MSRVPEGDNFPEELEDIRQETERFLGRRLLLWMVRWAIGFGMIAVIVHYQPRLLWLWWVGGGVALVTPLLSWFTRIAIDRKLKEADRKYRELQNAMEEFDEAADDE